MILRVLLKGFAWCAVACAGAVIGVSVAPFAVGQPQPQLPVAPPGGGKADLVERPRPPGGLLGDSIGEFLTIEGVKVEDGKPVERTLLVDTVDGKKLPKAVPIWVYNLDLPSKQRCVLTGYETGDMIGIPPAFQKVSPPNEQDLKDVDWDELLRHPIPPPGAQEWQWRPYFVALSAVEPKGLTRTAPKKPDPVWKKDGDRFDGVVEARASRYPCGGVTNYTLAMLKENWIRATETDDGRCVTVNSPRLRAGFEVRLDEKGKPASYSFGMADMGYTDLNADGVIDGMYDGRAKQLRIALDGKFVDVEYYLNGLSSWGANSPGRKTKYVFDGTRWKVKDK
jgi:hypothetical protein